ncbi:hypothetical protein [Bradyrhizobium liaoningense]|uniref:hypothetical protein n=1 Tax=Bradyrhizobium liaoningense TaxID=43992 RepID=UPI000551AD49|nr:hypothetical protein [Bradyrhizobium liaoningense]
MAGVRGDNFPKVESSRYVKFSWTDASHVPAIGELDYVPKGGAFRIFQEGTFRRGRTIAFPAQKKKEQLKPLGCCAYCGRSQDEQGQPLALTSEHVIAEALGCGIELPEASCSDCQRVTSEFERSVTEEMFDPVRRSLALKGKGGILKKQNFPVDVGTTVTDVVMLAERHHPTLLTLPQLYPASRYSRRPINTNGLFNILTYNINCRQSDLDRYGIDIFATQVIDTARLCQMVAKIAHVACLSVHGYGSFKPLVADFVRTPLLPNRPSTMHFNFVGRIWQPADAPSPHLHEVDVGEISWAGETLIGARVRLFASYGMPSYHVAVGL